MERMDSGNGRENLPPGCIEPDYDEDDEFFEPEACCEFCEHFDDPYCTLMWNNMDKSYCVPERDEKEYDDSCDSYEWNGEYLDYPRRPEKPQREKFGSEGHFRSAMRYYEIQMKRYRKVLNKIHDQEGDY